MKRFHNYTEFCGLDDRRKSRIFPLMVEQAAVVWYNDLPQVVKNDWGGLEEAFNQKYININNLNWVKEQDWFTRVQRKGESVESYIMDIRQKYHQLQKGDAETRSLIL